MNGNLVEKTVVCPHCWNNFHGDHAAYISQHPELYGDPVLGDNVPRRISYLEAKRDREGSVTDPVKGWAMIERACPRCHLQIPRDLLERRPQFISIVGAPNSGKTFFLTAMLHHLREELARYFSLNLEVHDHHDKSIFSRYADKLFHPDDPLKPAKLQKTPLDGDLYDTVELDGASVVLPKPFIFSLRRTDDRDNPGSQEPTSFVLYDNAGESFRFEAADDGSRRSTQHLGESETVLFAFDLLLDSSVRHKLKSVSQDPQVHWDLSDRQDNILTNTIQRIRRYRRIADGDRLDVTLLVCVQKFDVWKSLLPFGNEPHGDLQVLDQSSITYFEKQGVGGLDIQEMNAISLLVRELIHDCSVGFVTSAEAHFKRVRYFPVSALGCSPSSDGHLLTIQPSKIQPFRVTHPMLWILHEWGLIKRAVPAKENPRGFPVATIEKKSEDRVHVRSPSSGRLLKLDSEYAGSFIIDPQTGKPMWIPSTALNERIPNAKNEKKDAKGADSLASPGVDLGKHILKPTNSQKLQQKKPWWSNLFGRGSRQ